MGETVTPDGRAPAPTRIAYQPALDGLRAVAVTMVLLFHGGVSWMGGGYFGVSVFFTLSGFLITSLLVREFDQTGRIRVSSFYTRRMRRLLPASLVCLAAVTVLGAFDTWTGVAHLRRDVLGALFQVANWVQLFAGESYTDLQSERAGLLSPLDHYWSLAIEEQFYWLWPLAFVGLARLARRRGWSLLRVVAVLTVLCSAAAPIIAATAGRDAAYWATPARAGEILLGAVLAIAVAGHRVSARIWMAPVAMAVVIVIGVVLPAAGGPAYHGAFPLLASATVMLLLGLQRPGAVASLLATRPLVALGKISYGVYLFHFPAFVLMSPERMDVSGTSLLLLRLLATLAVAMASYWLLERPIRLGDFSGVRTAIGAVLVTAAVAGLTALVPAASSAQYYEVDSDVAAQARIQPVPTATADAPAATPTPTPTSTPTSTSTSGPPAAGTDAEVVGSAVIGATDTTNHTDPTTDTDPTTHSALGAPTTPDGPTVIAPLDRPARIVVVGDSTAMATGAGLVYWAVEHPDLAQVEVAASPGCGFVRGGVVPDDADIPFQSECDNTLDVVLRAKLRDAQPDVVMLMVTARDLVTRVWNEEDGPLTPPDPRYLAHIRTDYEAIVTTIIEQSSARVVWIRPPTVNPYWQGPPPFPHIDDELLAVVDGIIRDTVARHGDRAEVVDLRGWMEADGVAEQVDARPDGWHFSADGAEYVIEEFLGRELLDAAAIAAATAAAS